MTSKAHPEAYSRPSHLSNLFFLLRVFETVIRAKVGGWVMLKIHASLTPFCRCTKIYGKALDLPYHTNGEVAAQAISESLPKSFSPITHLSFVNTRLLPSLGQSGRGDKYPYLLALLDNPSGTRHIVRQHEPQVTRTANVVRPLFSPISSAKPAPCLVR